MSDLAIFGGKPAAPLHSLQIWPPVAPSLLDEIHEVLLSKRLNYGPDSISRDLEEQFAGYQSQKYALGTCSGSVALWAAYYGIQKGSIVIPSRPSMYSPEIIIGGYGFWATATAALYAGLRPVFCDVEEDTGNIDPIAVKQNITPQTIAIGVTHIDGHPADMKVLLGIAAKHNIHLIEDCSHAVGATLDQKRVGTLGTASASSLQTLKMLSGGEGGLLSTDDPEVFERAALLVNVRRLDQPVDPRLALTGLGLKLRISPLSAALALHNLKNLDIYISLRREKLGYLTNCLKEIGGVIPPVTRPECTRGAWYEYAVKYPDELDEQAPKPLFLRALEAEGVQLPHSNTRAFYRRPPFSIKQELPVADRLERETFFLPPFTFEGKEIIDSYVAAIEKVLRSLSVLSKEL